MRTPSPEFFPKSFDQDLGAGQHTAEGIAHPDRDRRRWRFPVAHNIEMRVKRRDLVHLGHGNPHLFGKRLQMPGREMPFRVLDQMQILDQVVTAQFAITQQDKDTSLLFLTQEPPLWIPVRLAPARSRVNWS